MEGLDYWRLSDELNVIQAALLIVGEDPAQFQEWVDGWKPEERPIGYDAARTALTHAVHSGRLPATKVDHEAYQQWDGVNDEMVGCTPDEADWERTIIKVEDIRSWLASRGFSRGFFFPSSADAQDYLDSNHTRYAPKLAAAIGAWLAIDSESALQGKSPKQSLMRWLREHAAEYKLSDDEGKPNETGIEECAKVANWQDKGGAPKTPGG